MSLLRGEDGGCDRGRLSAAGVPGGEGLWEEVHKRGLNDRDQEAERSRLSDVRRLRSPLIRKAILRDTAGRIFPRSTVRSWTSPI